jgi:hypothetical protein
MSDHALDALLAEYVAPPMPAGLAGRVMVAALALPQEPRLAYARRGSAAPRRDRRGAWLRRPMLTGAILLGLAVSGALAATLAGVRLDRLPIVAAVLEELPLGNREAPPPRAVAPAPPPLPTTAPPAEESPVPAPTEVPPPGTRAAPARAAAPPPAAPPADTPSRSEPPRPPVVEFLPPALPAPAPLPAPRDERSVPGPAPEPRRAAPGVDEEARLQQERIERAERLRAVRQAQIERLQRVQQRRERIRRLRRD